METDFINSHENIQNFNDFDIFFHLNSKFRNPLPTVPNLPPDPLAVYVNVNQRPMVNAGIAPATRFSRNNRRHTNAFSGVSRATCRQR